LLPMLSDRGRWSKDLICRNAPSHGLKAGIYPILNQIAYLRRKLGNCRRNAHMYARLYRSCLLLKLSDWRLPCSNEVVVVDVDEEICRCRRDDLMRYGCCCRQPQILLILMTKFFEGSRPDDKIQSPRSTRSAPIDEGLTR
jgi:hypothetical protein